MTATVAMAAGFALRDASGRLLLIHQDYGERRWDFVGGAAEAGEAPEEIAIREAREEIGLDVAPSGLIGVYLTRRFAHGRSLLLFIFAGTVTGGMLVLQPDEIVEIGWFGPDDLPPLIAWKALQVADVFAWNGRAVLRTRDERRDEGDE